MKRFVFFLGIMCSLAIKAQVVVETDSSFVRDGALVLRVKIINRNAVAKRIGIDSRKTLRQLNSSQQEEVNKASTPQNYIFFWDGKQLINEESLDCDQQLPQYSIVNIPAQGTHEMLLETRCLSETVLTKLNSGKTLLYKLYVRYSESGIMHTSETVLTKLKVRKPHF